MRLLKFVFASAAFYRRNIGYVSFKQYLSRKSYATTLFPRFQLNSFFCLGSGYVVTFSEDSTTTEREHDKVVVPEPKLFSNTFKLQQASNSALDSSVVVVSTSFQVLHFAYQEYMALLVSAIQALHRALEISPALCEELGIDEHLSLVQSDIFHQKTLISDSLFVYEEATKLANLAANISFLVGNETTSGLASSHLHNIQREVTNYHCLSSKEVFCNFPLIAVG